MANPILSFVDAPAVSPTTLVALNPSDALYVTADDFDLGSPTFEAGPDSVGGVYGFREVSFKVVLKGAFSAVATAQQAIAQKLLASRSWLMLDMGGTSKKMFLRTHQTAQAALEWQQTDFGEWELPVTLKCDPWLYGTLQTIGPVTITNNPASGTNPAWYKLPAILGDAPAPTKITLSPSVAWDGIQPMLSVTSVDSSQNPTAPIVWQTSAFTAGTDTSAETSNAAYSGGGYRAVSFATVTTLSGRLTGAAPSVPPMGVYKVLVRVVASSATTVYQLRYVQDLGGGVVARGFTKTFDPTSASGAWVDLGNFAFPYGWSPDRTDTDTSVAPSVILDVGRVSGSGTLNLDAFLLVPIETAWTLETRTLKIPLYDGPAASAQAILDGNNLRYLNANSSGVLIAKQTPALVGDFPRVTPGAVNVLHMVQQTDPGDISTVTAGDSITATCAVTISYYPRYLHMRPDST